MDTLQFIVITAIILSPILIFLYAIDGKIKPLLKNTRHILLYALAAEIVIMLYALFMSFVTQNIDINHRISTTVYGDFFMMLGFAVFTGVVTIIWWAAFFIKLLVKKK